MQIYATRSRNRRYYLHRILSLFLTITCTRPWLKYLTTNFAAMRTGSGDGGRTKLGSDSALSLKLMALLQGTLLGFWIKLSFTFAGSANHCWLTAASLFSDKLIRGVMRICILNAWWGGREKATYTHEETVGYNPSLRLLYRRVIMIYSFFSPKKTPQGFDFVLLMKCIKKPKIHHKTHYYLVWLFCFLFTLKNKENAKWYFIGTHGHVCKTYKMGILNSLWALSVWLHHS